jgi:hypothetical protein
MSESEHEDVEDIEACVREGRRPRDTGPYRVLIGDGLYRFHPVIIDAAALTGRKVCELAALTPPERHVLFAVQSDGLLEEIRLDEAVDLREGIEKFLAFQNDRIFRFLLNGADYQWGGAFITGATLVSLAKADAATHVAWLKSEDGGKRRIGPSELVDLSEPGLEEFTTGPAE